MLTIRAAARLLADATSPLATTPLAHQLGFTAPPQPLTNGQRRTLGLHTITTQAHVVEGLGARRLLVATVTTAADDAPTEDLRSPVAQIARQLARRAPTALWTLLVLHPTTAHLCLATVTDTPRGVQIAACLVDCRRVRDADAETVRSLATVEEADDLLHHARCTDILRRDAVSLRFFQALTRAVDRLAESLHATPPATKRAPTTNHEPSQSDRRELALVTTSRCLFLAFLEAKGWLDHRRDFLLHHATRTIAQGGRLHQRLLRPLFSGP